MSIYETIKEQLDLRAVAEQYGIDSRNGMTACIFHDDRNPSMKLYSDHYYCFGCSACGDVTAFTARLFGISQAEAAQKLASDFGIAEVHNTAKTSIKTQLTVIGKRQREQEALTKRLVPASKEYALMMLHPKLLSVCFMRIKQC